MPEIVQAKCPHCQHMLRIPLDWLSQPMRCKHCKKIFQAQPKAKPPLAASAKAPKPIPVKASPLTTPVPVAKKATRAAPSDIAEIETIPIAQRVEFPKDDLTANAVNANQPTESIAAALETVPDRAQEKLPYGPEALFRFDDDADTTELMMVRQKYSRRRGIRWWGIGAVAGLLIGCIALIVLAGPQLIDIINNRLSGNGLFVQSVSNGTDSKGELPGEGLFPRRALVISINNYLLANSLNYGSPRSAGFSGSSPKEVLNALGNFHMRFPNTQLFELSDSARGGATPTKPVIQQAIKDFLGTSRSQDRIVIVFAGHAVEVDGKAYLVPLEGDFDAPETLLPLSWLYDELAKCPAWQKVLIMDVCRFDPARGFERPAVDQMGEVLDKALASPPSGVQVWTACIAGQNSYEFEKGSVFLQSLTRAMWERLPGFQEPHDPLPLDLLVARVNTYLKELTRGQERKQVSRLSGTPPADGGEYNPADPLPVPLVIQPAPVPGGMAPAEVVQGILNEINAAPPARIGRSSVEDTLPLSALPPFSAKVLEEYKKDNYQSEKEFLQNVEQYPLRAATVKVKSIIKREAEKFQLQEYFGGGNSARIKEQIKREQEKPGMAIFNLKEALEELQAAEKHLDSEKSKRWKAHYHFVMGRLKSRLVYLEEYSFVLGKIRGDALPPLEGGATAYRLGSQMKPSVNELEVRTWRRELSRLWRKIIDDYPGTPWALLAQRENGTALGLEWRLSRD